MLQLLQLSGFDAASAGSVARFMASKLLSVSAAVLRVAVGQSSVVSRKSAPVNREADGQIHYAAHEDDFRGQVLSWCDNKCRNCASCGKTCRKPGSQSCGLATCSAAMLVVP